MRKQFAIIGLGRFGSSLCKELYKLGHEVLAVDVDEEKVDELTTHSTHTVIADTTDEKALVTLGLTNFDYVIVAIGEDIQSSILTTLMLKDLGVSKVWAKARNNYHQRVLEKIGADRVIHPEQDMGIRIAQQLTSEQIVDFIEVSDKYSIVELVASNKIVNKSIENLDIRAKYGCTILAIKRKDTILIAPVPSEIIYNGDVLIVIGLNDDLKRFEERML